MSDMVLVDMTKELEKSEEWEDILSESVDIFSNIYKMMGETETLWIFVPSILFDDLNSITPMAVAKTIQAETGLLLRNIITVHRHTGHDGVLRGSYEEILLLVKNKKSYYFDKDSIRIEPVYQGKEWNGSRENGQSAYRDKETKRYNSEGKDPGNVWMNEIRTETASNVLDRTMPFSRSEAITRCVRAGSKEGSTVTAVWPSEECVKIIQSEGRNIDIERNLEGAK
jgi:hypothetical protein